MDSGQSPGGALRVTRLAVSNFKRIVSADIQAGDRTLVILRGPNENGKTSTLEALVSTLSGKRALPEVPVTLGADSSVVEVTLGDGAGPRYRITRSVKADGGRTWLNVHQIGADGQPAKVTAGQTLLDSLVNNLSFDPLAFSKTQDRKTQIRMLYAAAGRQADYEVAQAKRARLYEQRSQANAKVKQLEMCLAELPDPAPGQQLRPVSEAELAQQLKNAEAHNARRLQHEQTIGRHISAATTARTKIQELQAEIRRMEAAAAESDQAAERTREALNQLSPVIDTNAIAAHIQATSEHNRKAEMQVCRAQGQTMVAEARAEADKLTSELAAVDQAVDAMLEQSDLGQAVPGLQVREGQILHNGVPFSQASGMRRLELSTLIGMAANPRLRILCVDEGDQLDDASLVRLKELAEKRDFAVWMTAIRAGDETDPDSLIVPVHDGRAVGAACAARCRESPTPTSATPADAPELMSAASVSFEDL